MSYNWDFSKLPKHEHQRVIDRSDSRDAKTLMIIHNQYELSDELYCCTKQNEMVLKWFKYGIENGYIKGEDS